MAPSTIAGRYVVERAVGHGGMGSVWLCRDQVLGRTVAVKEVGAMPGASRSDLARALREARSSAALNHRNVVSIYDAVEDGEHNWLVMEYVPSRNLSEVVRDDGALPPERVAGIGAQAADGLAAAHARGTVHRDVKPGNILVTDDDHVKITDFGIARTHGDAQLTRSGIVTGTPAFFAPEIARGAEPTGAADVWALGASLYAAVEGRLPYPDQGNAIALLAEIAGGPPRPAERAGLLAEPIARMMDPDPATRWSMTEVADALHRLHARHGTQQEGSAGPATVAFAAPAVLPTPATEDTPAPEAEVLPAPDPAPAPAPARSTTSDDDRSGGRRLGLVAAALALLVLVVGGLVLLDRGRDDAPSAGETPGSSGTGATEDEGGSGEGSSEGEGEGSGPGSGSDAPDDVADASDPAAFVRDYYALLPGDTEAAWARLSPEVQAEVGGYGTYEGFWRTISAVQVDDATAGDDGVVTVRLTYTSDRGEESENRTITVADGDDGARIVGDRAG